MIAPDLIGFGRSDKLARMENYSYKKQVDWLSAFLVRVNVKDATLVQIMAPQQTVCDPDTCKLPLRLCMIGVVSLAFVCLPSTLSASSVS